MMSISKVISVIVLMVVGVKSGPIPSCQQQITTALGPSFNGSQFNPTCVGSAIPGLLRVGGGRPPNPGGNCGDIAINVLAIIRLLLAALTSTTSICNVIFNPLLIPSVFVIINSILGLTGLGCSLLDLQLVVLANATAVVSVITSTVSPIILLLEIFLPLRLVVRVLSNINVLGLILPLNLLVTILARLRLLLRVSIGNVVTVEIAGPPVCSLDDFDFPLGVLSTLSLAIFTAIVHALVTALLNALADLLASLCLPLVRNCLEIAYGIKTG